jgi:hypothetical protein
MRTEKVDTAIAYLRTQERLIERIRDWLQDEATDSGAIINKITTTDGSDDFIVGRHECAVALLNQIKRWEEEL